MMTADQKIERLLDAKRRCDTFERAISTLLESKKAIREAARGLPRDMGQRSYAANRMACVGVEIDTALRGVRKERRDAQRALARIARSRVS